MAIVSFYLDGLHGAVALRALPTIFVTLMSFFVLSCSGTPSTSPIPKSHGFHQVAKPDAGARMDGRGCGVGVLEDGSVTRRSL
jgi:hypothetical protein